MKCKVGDMALVVRSTAGNEGKTVTCIRHFRGPTIFKWQGKVIHLVEGDWWELDRSLNMMIEDVVYPDHSPFAMDTQLMPIGDAPKEEVEHDGMASSMPHELV